MEKTLERDRLWEAQTPQVFRKALLLKAYQSNPASKVTDDASLVERLKAKVQLVPGKYENIKITTPDDLLLAGLISKRFKYAI